MNPRTAFSQLRKNLSATLDPANDEPHQPLASRGTMARAGAYLYGSGGLLVLATLALPHGHVNSAAGVVAVALVAISAAVGLLALGERVPVRLFPLISPFGSVMIAGVMFWGGSYAFAYEMLFVWAALYSFSFFSLSSAGIQAAAIVLAAGFYLFIVDRGSDSAGYFLMTAGTGAVAGVFIQRLIRQIEKSASLDTVTGALNRRSWDTELDRALARASRGARPVAVLLADLDHFKLLNDEHGHQAGDRFLADLVAGWRSLLRSGDVLARYGGEEFSIVLEGCDLEEAIQVANKLRAGVPAGLTCSLGAAEWDRQEGPKAVVARADAALYEAKRMGRDRVVAAPTQQVAREGALGDTARWAQHIYTILNQPSETNMASIGAAYQPIVRLDSRDLVGLEALARPIGAAAGLGVEGLFYTAQRLGRTRDLDWICRRAGLEGARAVRAGVQLFINTSMAALLDPLHDVDQMLLLLRHVGRDPQDVVLELTERETVLDPARMAEVLGEYRAAGFRFAVDDLGEGRSGMEVVAAAMPEYIKVARRLVSDDSLGSRAMIDAAVAFARQTGAEVIAEGLESEGELERMRAAGIHLGQGYLLGRPSFEFPAGVLAEPSAAIPLRVMSAEESA